MTTRSTARSQQALGEALARLRYERDLTQEELADAIGVSRRYVWELENAQPNLFATRLFELLRELGAHLEIAPDEASDQVSDQPSDQPSDQVSDGAHSKPAARRAGRAGRA